MIKILKGNLFKSNAQTLVNTVNCVGVMGKGIALEFKKKFPDMYKDYETRCKRNQVELGRPYLYVPQKLFSESDDRWILVFPTKDHWRSVSRLDDIIEGLDYFKNNYNHWGIKSIAFPPLGCGQGGLEWGIVGPTLYRHLKELDIPVELYAPYDTPHEELRIEFLDQEFKPNSKLTHFQRIKPGWVALVAILNEVEKEPYHWPVGRLMFQKIAYFATQWGIPTGLKFFPGSYGPYAKGLKEITSKLVNNGLIKEKRSGQMYKVLVGETYKDAFQVNKEKIENWDKTIREISDLFVRINAMQAEIAATVHFVAKTLNEENPEVPHTELEVFEETVKWKKNRRPQLDRSQIASTVRNLNMLGWIDVKGSKELPLKEPIAIK